MLRKLTSGGQLDYLLSQISGCELIIKYFYWATFI